MAATADTEMQNNVGLRLSASAERDPDGIAVVVARRHERLRKRIYRQVSFRELDRDSDLLADGLLTMGVQPGTRLVLLVPPSIDFFALVFGMFKGGIVTVLIDPGLGRRSLIRCLEEVEPEGFIAIPLAQAVRAVLRHRFPKARWNVTLGKRWFWTGPTVAQLRARTLSRNFRPVTTSANDPAAIIFTTGSTGSPKGVLYRHGNFVSQVDEIRDRYGIQPGEIDLAGFPLFGLFNAAMGVTTVIPEMDPARPAQVDPRNVIEALRDWKVTQAFASPALWNVVGRYCEQQEAKMPTLRRVLSAGAPVAAHVLRRITRAIHPDGEMYTPYGATEALPVASISAKEVLTETIVQSNAGAGTCVGGRFRGIEWKVIRIRDDPIATIDEIDEMPPGEIGELIVKGKVVTQEYVTQLDANALHKIRDGICVWHRMGDVGYLDKRDRFWFCGRKSHRVQTPHGTMFTVPCEAIINAHEMIYRSALVGTGPPGSQRPVIIAEPWPRHQPKSSAQRRRLTDELRQLAQSHELTNPIRDFLLHRSLPVDIRHNAKILREKLAQWAAKKIAVR